ncbi:class I SAM-dependent methyltransferase [Denitratimonas tolerans]|uniref:Class I SAM-dependent methyltransferase n=1 Tax=Denitratimonas tolerans TaxID=1338420 RepID=A0AAW9R3G4_9GAMM
MSANSEQAVGKQVSTESAEELFDRARALFASSDLVNLVSHAAYHCAGLPEGSRTAVNTEVDENDQMFLHSLLEHKDPGAALAQYYSIGIQQHALMSQLIKAIKTGEEKLRVLDFACGHGRALRFAVLNRSDIDLHASEIQEDALDFISRRLGVPVMKSAIHPADFHCEETFDLIWVASLFSHLPGALFEPWLAKLLSMLSPRGILCFSTKPMADAAATTGEGLEYAGTSELTPLSSEHYGTTHVTRDHVERMVARLDTRVRTVCLERCLAHEQDLYLSSRSQVIDLHSLGRSLTRGTWGWLDIKSVDEAGRLMLEGWALSLDKNFPLKGVRVWIDDFEFLIEPDIERGDVVDAIGAGVSRDCGWRYESDRPVSAGSRLAVTAESGAYTHVVYVGVV